MALLKKKCAHCKRKLEKGKEVFAEVKIPEFVNPKVKAFCNENHHNEYILNNQGIPSKKPYCLNCTD